MFLVDFSPGKKLDNLVCDYFACKCLWRNLFEQRLDKFGSVMCSCSFVTCHATVLIWFCLKLLVLVSSEYFFCVKEEFCVKQGYLVLVDAFELRNQCS